MPTNPLRQYFPFFSQPSHSEWIYLDSAATSQKLQKVLYITHGYYQQSVNVHRSSYKHANEVTQKFEGARRVIQCFINASDHKEIVWTKGATESINLLANCLAKSHLMSGQDIIISALEHHANIVPWQQVAQQLGLNIKVMPIDENGVLKLTESLALINHNTALVALSHVSNALGNINPVQDIIQQAKNVGALTVIDGTQAVSHLQVDVQQLDCDFYVFSGHKMFGPTGIGVLYGKLHLLEQIPPYQVGGEMIKHVSFQQASFQPPPLKFEAGTPNVAGVLGIAIAAEFISEHRSTIEKIEAELGLYLQQALVDMTDVRVWGDMKHCISTSSFTVENVNQYDLAVFLNEKNIALRVGHHCAMPLMETLSIEGTLRVSLSCYNSLEDVNIFTKTLTEGISLFSQNAYEPPTGNSDVYVDENAAELAGKEIGKLALAIQTGRSWDEKYRHIMLAGKALPRLSLSEKTSDTEIYGCESQVWVKCVWINHSLQLKGDSPSKIVRGLLAVIFEVLAGKTKSQILAFDLSTYLIELGLARHLSQSRGNGIAAVIDKIVDFCQLSSN